MPLDDVVEEIADFFDEFGEAFDDLVSLLIAKKTRKQLARAMGRYGSGPAILALGYVAFERWKAQLRGDESRWEEAGDWDCDDDDDDRDRDDDDDRRKARRQKKRESRRTENKKSVEEEREDPIPSPSGDGKKGAVSVSPGEKVETWLETVTITGCLRVNLVIAMVSAAGADGSIDDREMARLLEAIERTGASAEDKARLTRLLNQPPPIEEVAKAATSPLAACELFGAAVSVIENHTPAEILFLRRFARALELDDDLVETITAIARGESGPGSDSGGLSEAPLDAAFPPWTDRGASESEWSPGDDPERPIEEGR